MRLCVDFFIPGIGIYINTWRDYTDFYQLWFSEGDEKSAQKGAGNRWESACFSAGKFDWNVDGTGFCQRKYDT